jgi:PilZ domain
MSAQAQALVPHYTGRRAKVTPFRATRFDLHLPLKYRPVGQQDWREGITENVSRSGVLFRADEKLSLKTQLEFNLVLPVGAAGPSPAEVVCRGEVVRSEDANSHTLAAKIVQYHFEHGANTAQA